MIFVSLENIMRCFSDIYHNKRILITGHTGFKGSWLTCWLLHLGAKVYGVSIGIPTQPSMFEALGLESQIGHFVGDIRNFDLMKEIVSDFQPDFVFHLAAQSIVSRSHDEPLETINTNVVGTANVLEALREMDKKCCGVIITSDKCYANVEWPWGYRETDILGGKDLYSSSKAAAEIIFKSYVHSFFPSNKKNIVRLATTRAGNVIGGGDWAEDRIVADCMRAWSMGRKVEIRRPQATRPWQHVLEPLSGYLSLGQVLSQGIELHGESFNFGPRSEQNKTVKQLLEDLSGYWDFSAPTECFKVVDSIPFHEAGLLKLNCDKALFHLKWQPTLSYDETIEFVSRWYYDFYKKNKDIMALTVEQVELYQKKAMDRGLSWCK